MVLNDTWTSITCRYYSENRTKLRLNTKPELIYADTSMVTRYIMCKLVGCAQVRCCIVFQINTWLTTTLISQCKTGVICEAYSIGKSIEGRDINAFRVSATSACNSIPVVPLCALTHSSHENTSVSFITVSTYTTLSLTDLQDWYRTQIVPHWCHPPRPRVALHGHSAQDHWPRKLPL